MLSRLSHRKLIEWNQVAKAYLPTKALAERAEDSPPLSLSDSFENLEGELAAFAQRLALETPPCSFSLD